MFTDIVGYDSLLKEDAKKAFEILRKNQGINKWHIKKHKSRWLKEMGGSILTSFSVSSFMWKAKELKINFTNSYINPECNLHETEKDLIIGLPDYQDKVFEGAERHDSSMTTGVCYEIADFPMILYRNL